MLICLTALCWEWLIEVEDRKLRTIGDSVIEEVPCDESIGRFRFKQPSGQSTKGLSCADDDCVHGEFANLTSFACFKLNKIVLLKWSRASGQ